MLLFSAERFNSKSISFSGDEVKKKWENLRDTYMRHIKTNKTKTGQATKSGKKWLWADQMEAFCPFLSFAKTSSNVSEIPRTNDDTNVQYSENIHKEVVSHSFQKTTQTLTQ